MSEMKPSPNAVYIVGIGLTQVAEHWERSLRELALEAIQAARAESPTLQPEALYVANMLSVSLSAQAQLGALLADFAGLRGIEACTVEAAGASGGAALRQAYLALRSGACQAALVVGAEKVSDKVSAEIEAALATASDADFESVQGITAAALAALLMRRYLNETQAPPDALAGFSLNAHANAAANPYAMFRRPIKKEAYARAAMLSEPVSILDAAPVADGAAALLLARGDALPEGSVLPPIRIAASTIAVTAPAIHDRPDPLFLTAAAEAAHRAYQQAGLSAEEVDLFELHDVFTIYAALALEAAGFAARGEGWRLAQDGAIGREGKIPICTFGGSKGRGDTAGATGVYQAAEVVMQLQGRAGENQVRDARIGMAQCLGGSGATAATHILIRDDGL